MDAVSGMAVSQGARREREIGEGRKGGWCYSNTIFYLGPRNGQVCLAVNCLYRAIYTKLMIRVGLSAR